MTDDLPDIQNFDYIEEYPDRAWQRFPSRYRGGERIQALVRALADGAQMLEDLIYEVMVSSLLDNATGALLDQWGELAGAPRGPFEDDVYRRIIKARMLVNVSSGKVDELIQIYEVATAPSDVLYWTHYPSGFKVTAHRSSPMTRTRRRRVREIMEDAKPGGVSMTLCEAGPDALRLDDDPDTGMSSTLSRTF